MFKVIAGRQCGKIKQKVSSSIGMKNGSAKKYTFTLLFYQQSLNWLLRKNDGKLQQQIGNSEKVAPEIKPIIN